MYRFIKWSTQGMAYAVFMAGIGYFSVFPAYEYLEPSRAVIKMAFSHAGERKEECRRLTPEEIQKLAPNMRRPTQCGRERLPVIVELYLDGDLLYAGAAPPSGIWGDGTSTVYERFVLAPGSYVLTARLRDSYRTDSFDFEHTKRVELHERQNFVVSFRPELGGFSFD